MLNALDAKFQNWISGWFIIVHDGSSEYSIWKKCNYMVVAWLRNSTSPVTQPSLAFMRSAKAILDDLEHALGKAMFQ